ncbi:MAG: hypothetical protein JWR03_2787 [Cohnella sp.]|nr:hypothetical protein [Cohnella sp.]
MSMNIGPMLRALMGDMQPAEGARVMELRVGQIVRGVLMKMLDNHEALMNIGGVQVRAKLQTDLPVGRGTLLQVQPGSKGGAITLKPLADPSDLPADEGLKGVLKSFGMPDQKWSLELMRGLKRDGYPIGKDTAAYFQTAVALKPAGTDMHSWMGAADVAFRRGLAVSEDTIGSLRQALFGQPLHMEIAGLAAVLKEWQADGGTKSPIAAGLAGRLRDLLAEGEALLAEGETQLSGGTEDRAITGKPSVLRQQAPAVQPPVPDVIEDSNVGHSGPERADTTLPSASTAVITETAKDKTLTAVDARRTAARGQPLQLETQHSTESNKPGIAAKQPAERPDAFRREPVGTPPGSAPRGETAWIGRFLQWMGTGHEHRLLYPAPETHTAVDPSLLAGGSLAAEASDGIPREAEHTAADSLKSTLIAIAAHEDTPPALREAAQNVVSQITGQQLLLSTERQPNAPFSLMTLFVPMKGQNGDTTATVHVQTRRSRRGEWDTDNCRLLFDLRMRHLGDTVVDVQVVDRIVSLKLMNDYPGMAELVDQARDEVNSALRSAGFQLLSITASPLPSYKEVQMEESSDKIDNLEKANSAAYAAKPYKGVDFRA